MIEALIKHRLTANFEDWRSSVARLYREQEVVRSSRTSPTVRRLNSMVRVPLLQSGSSVFKSQSRHTFVLFYFARFVQLDQDARLRSEKVGVQLPQRALIERWCNWQHAALWTRRLEVRVLSFQPLLGDGVIGSTLGFGPRDSRFESWSPNSQLITARDP